MAHPTLTLLRSQRLKKKELPTSLKIQAFIAEMDAWGLEWTNADADIGLDRVAEQLGAIAQFTIDNAMQNEAKFRAVSSQLRQHSSLLQSIMQKTNNIVRVLRGLLVRVAAGQAKEGSDNDTDAFVSRYNNGFGYNDAADMVSVYSLGPLFVLATCIICWLLLLAHGVVRKIIIEVAGKPANDFCDLLRYPYTCPGN